MSNQFVYIADSATGLFKIGQTRRPVSRAKQLSTSFRSRGQPMRRIYFWMTYSHWSGIEYDALKQLRTMCPGQPPCGREWFQGMDWTLAKEIIDALFQQDRKRRQDCLDKETRQKSAKLKRKYRPTLSEQIERGIQDAFTRVVLKDHYIGEAK